MAVLLPHFDAVFRFDTTGKPVVVEQGSAAEIGAAVFNIVTCPQGAKLNDPGFGIPSPLFDTLPIDLEPILAAVQTHEPRAQMTGAQAVGAITLVEQIVGTLLPSTGLLPGPTLSPDPGQLGTTAVTDPNVVTVDLTATVTTQEGA